MNEYRYGVTGTATVHMYNQGKLENPRAICGWRGDFVTFVTGSPTCRRCLQAAGARKVREAAARRYR